MLTDFLKPADFRWRQVLDAVRHDVYDLPGYAALSGEADGAEPLAFYARENDACCLVPLLRRRLPAHLHAPAGWSDAISPYGYSGALFAGDDRWASRAVRAFREACAARGILSVLLRLHPLLAAPEEALAAEGEVVAHGETVWVDLTAAAQVRSDHRAGIRRLRREGFGVRVDDWSLYGRFQEIYAETMSRLDADSAYRFSASYFQRLAEELGAHLHLISVVAPDGAVAAAGLFTELGGVAQFHLSGTAEAYRRLAPSKLMLDAAIEWARANGNRVLHLGGGLGARQDSLFEFKAGFSPLRARFATWRMICDPARYAALSGGAVVESFPAYRRAA